MITPTDWLEMKNLIRQGLTKTEISVRLDVSRQTVYNNISKTRTPVYTRKPSTSKLDDYKSHIDTRLSLYNLTAKRLFYEVKGKGYTGKYGLVVSYVNKRKKELKNSAVLRFETMPGEQAQVDWGFMGKIFDKQLKKVVEVCCFVIILGYSRMRFVKFYTNAKSTNFLDGHNSAFEYFGGYTKEILYDNLKSVVIKRGITTAKSDFNRRFIDFSGYYGYKPVLCRPYKPCTKGKVEKSVDYVKRDFYDGIEWNSISEINKASEEWLAKVNNTIHATTHKKPTDRLSEENLLTVSNGVLFDLSEEYYRKVFSDCHFSYNANRYSVPYKYAGKEIIIKEEDNDSIIVKYRGEIVATHKLNTSSKGVYITNKEHLEGLLELRTNSEIRRPFRKKTIKTVPEVVLNNCITFNNKDNLETDALQVDKRSLDYYERIY
jgi:transposase